jgi:uncharacterized membrane protein
MYDFLLTVHVLAAVVWVGGSVVMHILGRRVLKRGDGAEIHSFSQEINKVALALYAPLALILLVAGVFLVDEAGYEYSQLWITLAFVAWGISFVLGVGYYGPHDKKLQKIVTERGATDPGVAQNVRQALTVNQFELLILLLVVVDMTTKPGV